MVEKSTYEGRGVLDDVQRWAGFHSDRHMPSLLKMVLATSLCLAALQYSTSRWPEAEQALLLRGGSQLEDMFERGQVVPDGWAWQPAVAGRDFALARLDGKACEIVAARYHMCKMHFATGFDRTWKKMKCEFNVAKDTAYLPEPAVLDCLERFNPVVWHHDALAMEKKIIALQFPASCETPKSSVFIEPSWSHGKDKNGEDVRVPSKIAKKDLAKPKWELVTWLGHGWGYNLYVYSWNVMNHWSEGIPVLTSNNLYRFSDRTCGRGYSCEMSQLSNCSIETTPAESILVFAHGESPTSVMTLDQLCGPHGKYEVEFGRCNCDPGFLPAADSKYFYCKPYSAFDFSISRKKAYRKFYETRKREAIEGSEIWFSTNAPGEENPHNTYNMIHFRQQELQKRHGFLWYHMQSIHYLLKNARTKDRHEQKRVRLGLDKGRCLAIHVRHGDSCHDKFQDHRVCLPLEDFIKAARKLVHTYGHFDKVFLATDDPQVIEDTKQFKDEFTFVYQKLDREFYETGDSEGVDVRTEFEEKDKIAEITSDIYLMSHCHAFVGSMASSVGWVTYEYMSAMAGHYMPFISVDLPIAHHKNIGRFFEPEEEAKYGRRGSDGDDEEALGDDEEPLRDGDGSTTL